LDGARRSHPSPRAGSGIHSRRCCRKGAALQLLGADLPDAWSNLVLAKLLAKDPFGAVSCADRALEMDARHVPALYNKAAALGAQGLEDECVAVLDALLKIAPDFAPALESRRRRVTP
jgi:tetratricopeptide (TPR) repeat protein